MNHPSQPIVKDVDGRERFKQNSIVRALLNFGREHGFGLNEIAQGDFPAEDHIQLAQLIGYSLAGYSELSYVTTDAFNAAQLMADEGLSEQDARVQSLQSELDAVRAALQMPMARLFGVHPDYLANNIVGSESLPD